MNNELRKLAVEYVASRGVLVSACVAPSPNEPYDIDPRLGMGPGVDAVYEAMLEASIQKLTDLLAAARAKATQ